MALVMPNFRPGLTCSKPGQAAANGHSLHLFPKQMATGLPIVRMGQHSFKHLSASAKYSRMLVCHAVPCVGFLPLTVGVILLILGSNSKTIIQAIPM